MNSNISEILQTEPAYRLKQIHQAWFDLNVRSYGAITTLSKDLRGRLKDQPFLSVKPITSQQSADKKTTKALFDLSDGLTIESVLMGRDSKKQDAGEKMRYTVCVSTQAGCPMACSFCATGKLGFKRNLTSAEIVDQLRFWMYFLADPDLHRDDNSTMPKVDNLVLMGQGEPLLNYENVKDALNIILENTEIGPRQITISTAGVRAGMEKMIEDKNFPSVRFALSLHSAISETRKKLMPSHLPDFMDWLVEWSKKYHERFSSRNHFIGLEYTFIEGTNSDDKHLKALVKLASKLGKVRINLIPYNTTVSGLTGSNMELIMKWRDELMKKGFVVTIRHSQGQDIAAACGPLANS